MSTENRGGRRDNAGRKELPATVARGTVSFRVSPKTKERIAKLKQHGVQLGSTIDAHIEKLCSELGIED